MFKTESFFTRLALILFVGILVFIILIYARNFLYPLSLAVLFSYLLFPISSALEKIKVPRGLAIIVSILIGISVFGAIIFFLYNRLTFFLDDLPALKANAQQTLDQILDRIEANFGLAVEGQKRVLRDGINQALETGALSFQRTFSSTTTTIFTFGIMPVYVFFMTFYRNRFRGFILLLTAPDRHPRTNKILDEISKVTTQYVGGVTMVVLILCVLNSVGLWIVGIKYALMFGIISALMNFIPYFGTILGAAFPLLFTIISGTPEKALGVIVLFAIIQFTENNILTPNITGGSVQINPFFTILVLVIGGITWGIPGMLVAVPALGMMKIVFDNVETLNPFSYLLGWEKPKRYIRLKRRPDKAA